MQSHFTGRSLGMQRGEYGRFGLLVVWLVLLLLFISGQMEMERNNEMPIISLQPSLSWRFADFVQRTEFYGKGK